VRLPVALDGHPDLHHVTVPERAVRGRRRDTAV
jgi:hypothetical protein